LPKFGDKKKLKGKKMKGLRYEYSTYFGEDLGWVDSFRDLEAEKNLTAYYKSRADYEEDDFQRKINKWDISYKKLAKK
jgi:hypothetical protein